MPPITLPLSFTNSFWSQDYRRGLETLFHKLEQGIAEDDEIVSFLEARVRAEYDIAATLSTPTATGPRGTGFSADDGASLLMAFWGLKQEAKAQGDGHKAVANDLKSLALQPFATWAKGHEERIADAKLNLLDMWLKDYEDSYEEIERLKNEYHTKMRKADEAEDDAKFAPNTDYADHYTATSPRQNGRNAVVNRTPSVSERIAERLRELRTGATSNNAQATPATELILSDTEKRDGDTTPTIATSEKGKGKAVETSSPLAMSPVAEKAPLPPPKIVQPEPVLLAGIAMTPAAISELLRRAHAGLPLRPVRLPIIGEYPDCFTGEEFVNWLQDNVEAFGGSLDHAAEAARELTEDEGLLRRIGEIGNSFEVSREAFYQFRPKAFAFEEARAENANKLAVPGNLQPVADNLLKRSGTLANFVMKQIKTGNGPPPYVRARSEAQEADNAYRTAVRRLDRERLALEDRIEEVLKLLQKWELERLRVVKEVLLKYQASLGNLPLHLQPSIDRSTTLIASYQPESDLTALIERYRTGPFRPQPHIYESVLHDGTDVVFGIDLRKWAGESGWAAVRISDEEKKPEAVPPILSSLLAAMEKAYEKLASDEEKRRTWIYEIPLPILHHLREALNSQPVDTPIPVEFFEKVDAPVLAGVIKLWLLELDPPVGMWEGWDDFRRIYPAVGVTRDVSEEQHLEDVRNALYKLPKIHLYVLDTVIKHVKHLVDTTKSEEDIDVYLTKLAYSLGRVLLRPKQENHITIQDRHPTLLFIDLVKHYDVILPSTVEKKKREADKPIPIRKRTTLVDQRINRRSAGTDLKQALEAREAQIRPSPAKADAAHPAPVAPAKVDNDLPPRPKFTTPPPEADDLPPRPKFTTPPPESDEPKKSGPVVVQAATPERSGSPASPKQPGSPLSDDMKSPTTEDKPLASGISSLARSGSGETSRVRRPGGARGPRAPGAPAVSTAHHRLSSYGSDRPKSPLSKGVDPNEYKPKKRDGRTSAGAFSKKGPASGSEDEVAEK
ncbi:hypothetical protein FRC19_009933 [Serendipita sp. 401]|nr:hypothetical protein FRC15_003160 [Serendipita sp. 397]KAG8828077.1 hypothetical protein FRC19_009933 [Serendipita sp. 401]KAG8875237.1 hypothetical protein FRC20_004162 [Serendipita sp. 405]KAG9058387.1 hypothetical protein FS842_010113 [Serendipita sp. 407]